ncbi:MAG: serine--tRNA ligase [Bacteroidetes bacterium]|nr:serine--tRNA ligase [Bacteroidota bacterium]
MLTMALLRQDPEGVKKKLHRKHFAPVEIIDYIIGLDDRRKKLQSDVDNLLAQINAASKEIGQLMAKGQREDAEAKKQAVAGLKDQLQPLQNEQTQVEQELHDELVKVPNLPADLVPDGKAAADNLVVKEGGTKPVLAQKTPHWDLIKQYDLIDFETGAKLTGSGFPLYKGKGAKLQRALIQYFLDHNTDAGYLEYIPPYMVNQASAYATGQLPDKEGQMYHITADNFYLIPTAEVPVTNIYRDTILKPAELPVKMTAYTPCFRREAGSFGADVRGLNRVHQFDKVEIVQLVDPATSYQVLDEMVAHVEKLLVDLELPYRILRLCAGDMSFNSALTYDFEVFSAAQEKWLEVSSVSNFETFQANRMKLRYKEESGKTQLLHTLNGSSLALPRIVAALLENNQTPEGIKLPKVLHRYFGSEMI